MYALREWRGARAACGAASGVSGACRGGPGAERHWAMHERTAESRQCLCAPSQRDAFGTKATRLRQAGRRKRSLPDARARPRARSDVGRADGGDARGELRPDLRRGSGPGRRRAGQRRGGGLYMAMLVCYFAARSAAWSSPAAHTWHGLCAPPGPLAPPVCCPPWGRAVWWRRLQRCPRRSCMAQSGLYAAACQSCQKCRVWDQGSRLGINIDTLGACAQVVEGVLGLGRVPGDRAARAVHEVHRRARRACSRLPTPGCAWPCTAGARLGRRVVLAARARAAAGRARAPSWLSVHSVTCVQAEPAASCDQAGRDRGLSRFAACWSRTLAPAPP